MFLPSCAENFRLPHPASADAPGASPFGNPGNVGEHKNVCFAPRVWAILKPSLVSRVCGQMLKGEVREGLGNVVLITSCSIFCVYRFIQQLVDSIEKLSTIIGV